MPVIRCKEVGTCWLCCRCRHWNSDEHGRCANCDDKRCESAGERA